MTQPAPRTGRLQCS
ncbi:BgTH12-05816 [Blumeria graminis f. sp. triticale]|uniref:BgTH12-05816 n=1 Tax=Blumeria graminis f. sp. triticale TaxID=1689686 RepID=A0A9W4D4S4_BLUGR|nr:BgTH12-05816 [Blumeria graminis f. sp. triticale]